MAIPAGTKNPGDLAVRDEIRALMRIIISAAEKADVERTFTYLTRQPGGLFFLNNRHYDLEALLAKFRDTYSKLQGQTIRLDHEEVIVSGPDTAIWIGYGEGRTEAATGTSASYSFAETWVWQKQGGRWVVTHYHESAG